MSCHGGGSVLHCERFIATSTRLDTYPKDNVFNCLPADSCRQMVERCHTVQQLRGLLSLKRHGLVQGSTCPSGLYEVTESYLTDGQGH